MKTHMKKLLLALFGLSLAGAAHAVPIAGTYNLVGTTPQSIDTWNFTGSKASTYYEIDLGGAGTSGLNVESDFTFWFDQPVTYTLYNDKDSSTGSAKLGSEIGSITLGGLDNPSTWALSLAAGAQYILKITLNGATAYAQTIISDPAVSAVPLPGTALLFATALLGGAGLMRRRGHKGNAAAA